MSRLASTSSSNIYKVALIFISTLLLSSCSAVTEYRKDLADKWFGDPPADAPTPLEKLTPQLSAKVDWKANLGDITNYQYSPALSPGGMLYTNNSEGEVIKIDTSTGEEIWRINLNELISAGTEFAGGLVIVGTKKGALIALNVKGKELWRSFLSSEVSGTPRYSDGVVIARTGDNRIYGIDAADGSRKWVYERSAPALTLRSSAGLAVSDGAVYAGFAGGKFVAVRADNGKLLWQKTVAIPKGVTEIERITDITSPPFVDGPVVYTVAYQGKVAALDRRNGKVNWDRAISSYKGLSAENDKVFVSHTLGSIYALDSSTGRSFWRQADLLYRQATRPLVLADAIAVGDLEGYVHLLDKEVGALIGRIQLGSDPISSLIKGTNENQFIALTTDGQLYAVYIDTIKASTSPAKQEKIKLDPVAAQPDDEFDDSYRSTTKEEEKIEPAVNQPDEEFSDGSSINE